jgi:hypothetical protein
MINSPCAGVYACGNLFARSDRIGNQPGLFTAAITSCKTEGLKDKPLKAI